MPRKPIARGRRTAPTAGGSSAGPTDFTLSGKPPRVVPADSYDVRVLGARAITYKASGATAVELTFETEDGVLIDLDTLLVNSLGGTSNMILRNRGMLRDLADMDDDAQFLDVLVRLNRGDIRAEISVKVGEGMGGRTLNKLDSVDAIITDEE